MKFITFIQAMCDTAFSQVQINDYFARPFPRQCPVWQGYPMSMVINPLICLLERHLTEIWIGHETTRSVVVAYADDATIFVTVPADIQTIRDLLLTYESAPDARLNIQKSKSFEAGLWDTSMNFLNVFNYQGITTLDFRFMSMAASSGHFTCSRATVKIKALVRHTWNGTYVYDYASSTCKPFYSPRYGTQHRFSGLRRNVSDNS